MTRILSTRSVSSSTVLAWFVMIVFTSSLFWLPAFIWSCCMALFCWVPMCCKASVNLLVKWSAWPQTIPWTKVMTCSIWAQWSMM